MNQTQLPTVLQNVLTCVHCNEYLSVGPIGFLPNGGSICGRCRTLVGLPPSTTFMIIAKEFLYPCKYWTKGCGNILKFNEVGDHEFKCKFGTKIQLFCSNPCAYFCRSPKQHTVPYNAKSIKQMPDKIQANIYCNVCQEYIIEKPIYLTETGRDICHACGANQNLVRNYALETILDIFLMHCPYINRGCENVAKFGAILHEHTLRCPFAGRINRNTFISGDKQRGVIQLASGGHAFGTIKQFEPITRPSLTHADLSGRNSPRASNGRNSPRASNGYYIHNQVLDPRNLESNNNRRNTQINAQPIPLPYETIPLQTEPPAKKPNKFFMEGTKKKGIINTPRGPIYATLKTLPDEFLEEVHEEYRRNKKPIDYDSQSNGSSGAHTYDSSASNEEKRVEKQPKTFVSGNKKKGVINTPRGPIYATITQKTMDSYEDNSKNYKHQISYEYDDDSLNSNLGNNNSNNHVNGNNHANNHAYGNNHVNGNNHAHNHVNGNNYANNHVNGNNDEIPTFYSQRIEGLDGRLQAAQIPRYNDVMTQIKMQHQNRLSANENPERFGSLRIKTGIDY